MFTIENYCSHFLLNKIVSNALGHLGTQAKLKILKKGEKGLGTSGCFM